MTIVTLFFLFSIALVAVGLWDIAEAALTGAAVLAPMLSGTGLVTVALAVFEVGKFLAEEELIRERELGSIHEARYSLTKFMSLVIIVVCIEAIVLFVDANTKLGARPLPIITSARRSVCARSFGDLSEADPSTSAARLQAHFSCYGIGNSRMGVSAASIWNQ